MRFGTARPCARGRAVLLLGAAVVAAGACATGDGKQLAAAPSTTASVTTTSVAPAIGSPPADLPVPIVAPSHGSNVWAVYLATGPSADDPAVEAAVAAAESHGYSATVGQVSCDVGAAEALATAPNDFVVALYFESESDARRFADGYEPSPVAVVSVQIMCAD
ncbi:MAG TPA: hypothetical protein VM345_15205 [Acidimicrobiales bacterium]|nr:hypothetical protein [Acidimicrobiales bacterium]